MPVSPRLSAKLKETMGQSAAGDLVNWSKADLHGFETRLTEHIHSVDNRVADVKADLMKWSFVFWVGAVGAIAMLAGVLP